MGGPWQLHSLCFLITPCKDVKGILERLQKVAEMMTSVYLKPGETFWDGTIIFKFKQTFLFTPCFEPLIPGITECDFGDRVCQDKSELGWGRKGGPWVWLVCPWEEEIWILRGSQEFRNHLQVRERPQKNQIGWYLNLGPLTSRTVRKYFSTAQFVVFCYGCAFLELF